MQTHSFLTAAALAATTAPALAHSGQEGAGLVAGFLHPVSGTDHVLAMVAVGFWAASLGGRALWLVPAAFVSAMAAGFVLGAGGLVLPAIGQGTAASVFLLGVMIATTVRMPRPPSMVIIGVFGLFHGQAHGAEPTGSAVLFGAGFMAATLLLHAAGLCAGSMLARQRVFARALGAAIAGAGLLIAGGMA